MTTETAHQLGYSLVLLISTCSAIGLDTIERNPFPPRYLDNPDALSITYVLKEPIEVWPDRALQNLAQLEVKTKVESIKTRFG